MWKCPNCGEQIPDFKDSCAFCETAKPKPMENYCINPGCTAYRDELNDDRKVCDQCGGLTRIGKIVKSQS